MSKAGVVGGLLPSRNNRSNTEKRECDLRLDGGSEIARWPLKRPRWDACPTAIVLQCERRFLWGPVIPWSADERLGLVEFCPSAQSPEMCDSTAMLIDHPVVGGP